MAVLKSKDIQKMSEKEKNEKIKELRIELIKNKTSNKGKIQTKEIKRAIARLLTFNKETVDNKEK